MNTQMEYSLLKNFNSEAAKTKIKAEWGKAKKSRINLEENTAER